MSGPVPTSKQLLWTSRFAIANLAFIRAVKCVVYGVAIWVHHNKVCSIFPRNNTS
jgi:hypothetical protein